MKERGENWELLVRTRFSLPDLSPSLLKKLVQPHSQILHSLLHSNPSSLPSSANKRAASGTGKKPWLKKTNSCSFLQTPSQSQAWGASANKEAFESAFSDWRRLCNRTREVVWGISKLLSGTLFTAQCYGGAAWTGGSSLTLMTPESCGATEEHSRAHAQDHFTSLTSSSKWDSQEFQKVNQSGL